MDYVAGEMMNEQAQKVLIDLLNRAISGIDKAVEFSQAQIPDVIHQLLMWNFVESLMMTIMAIATIYPFFVFSRGQFKRIRVTDDSGYDRGYKTTMIYDRDGDVNPLSIVYGIVSAFYSATVIIAILDFTWLKIWIAPKLYLLEYVASLAK